MVMRAGPHPRKRALTTVRHRPFGPWWLWAAVVFLFGMGAYSTYLAKTTSDRLKEAHATIAALAADKVRLASSDTATTLKLEESLTAREQAEAALKQSRVDADAAAALVGELQKRLKAAQAEIKATQTEINAARASAAASKKEAERAGADADRANAAFTQVRNLQERVAALKAEADAASEAKATIEREVGALKGELADVRQKLDAGSTASTGR